VVVCKALTSLGVFWVLFVASCSPSFGLALCLATPPTVVILANYHCEQEKRMAPFGARAQAPGQKWTQSGMLRCKLNPSIGFVIFGHQSMECRFVPSLPGPQQIYDGALNTVGIEVGVIGAGGLAWGVLAPTSGVSVLAGEYVGASGDVALGAGVGANVVRSTTHRFGRTTNPFVRSERLTISTFTLARNAPAKPSKSRARSRRPASLSGAWQPCQASLPPPPAPCEPLRCQRSGGYRASWL
jgi:hypothetical protein